MNKRFILELTVGIILLISVIIFGQKGFAVFALLAIHPFVSKKKKLDERESQLFNKIGNSTAGATLLASVVIYYFSDFVVNGQAIGGNWLFYVCSAFLIAHGLSGLIILKNK